ncbi:MAG: hypothetical protein ACON35_02810 [Candidatus Marinamargulisbacteria bacterium]
MKLTFSDLFDEVGSHFVPKKNIRIGALVIPINHPVDPTDPDLGLPLADWKNKSFDVIIDQDTISIQKVS